MMPNSGISVFTQNSSSDYLREGSAKKIKFKLRADAVVQKVDDAYIIKYRQGKQSTYLKMAGGFEDVIFALQQGTSIDELTKLIGGKKGFPVIEVVYRLMSHGILDGWENPPRQTSSRIRKSLLSVTEFRLFQFHPDGFLSWLYDKMRLRILFSPFFVIPVFILSTFMFIILCQQGVFTHSVISAANSNGTFFIVFYLSIALGIFIHEIAHALTCKHYGREVPSMGLLLLLFVPAGFSDVSDSYLLDKRKRIAVLLAGPLVSMFLGIWVGAFWLFSAKGTYFGELAHLLAIVAFCSTLFSLNPLLKFDGYYLLQELVGTTNLRSKSFFFLKSSISRIFSTKLSTKKEGKKLSPQKGLIYISYGIFSLAFTGCFLFFVIQKWGGYIYDIILFLLGK